jgi:hypothetical protein
MPCAASNKLPECSRILTFVPGTCKKNSLKKPLHSNMQGLFDKQDQATIFSSPLFLQLSLAPLFSQPVFSPALFF